MESERNEAYKDPEVERFLTNIITKKSEIVSTFDLKFGYRYPDVEEWLGKKPKEAKEFLEKLSKVGILERRLDTMELRCPKCESPDVGTSYICPFCNSIDIMRDALIEHLTCGYVDTFTNFKSNDDYVCPKCHNKLEAGNYRTAGSWYSCMGCGKKLESPAPQHKCRSCGTVFDLDTSIYEKVYSYFLSKVAKDEINHGMLLRGAIRESAIGSGYTVNSPYSMTGRSGVMHTFDMLLLRQDVKMAVDVILSDSPISQDDILKEYNKLTDTKMDLSVVVIPGLSSDSEKLAVFYKINVIASPNPNRVLEAFTNFLESKKR